MSNIVVAGFGCQFAQTPDLAGFAARVRSGDQVAGYLDVDGEDDPSASLNAGLTAVLHEALEEARLPEGDVVVLFVEPGTDQTFLALPGDEAKRQICLSWEGFLPRPPKIHAAQTVSVAMQQAHQLLETRAADAVVLLTANVLKDRNAIAGQDGFSAAFEKGGKAPPLSEGASAIVLSRDEDASRQRAVLSAIGVGEGGLAASVQTAVQSAMEAATWQPSDVGVLLLDGRRDSLIPDTTLATKAISGDDRQTGIGAVRALIGDAGAAADLASIVMAVLCLERTMIPPLPQWTEAGPAALREATSLFVASSAVYWTTTPDRLKRRAAIALRADNNQAALICLEAGKSVAPISETLLTPGRPHLFPLAADDRAGIEFHLRRLEEGLESGGSLTDLSRDCLHRACAGQEKPVKAALIASTTQELTREINFMRRGLKKAETESKMIKTPNGSVFAPEPLAAEENAKVAFVFPGNGAAYVGLAQEATLSFARSITEIEPFFEHRLDDLLRTQLIYPRDMKRFNASDEARFAERLAQRIEDLAFVGIAISVFHNRLMADCLSLKPDAVIGFSIGEAAMRVATGQWAEWKDLEKLVMHPVVTEGLSGKMKSVEAFWQDKGITPQAAPGVKNPLWAAYYVRGDLGAVLSDIETRDDIFVQSINSPSEAVVCGNPAACAQFLARHDVMSLPLEFDLAIHSPPAAFVRNDIESLCDSPVEAKPGIDFYSAARSEPVEQTKAETAAALADMLTSQMDFSKLIERAYDDGVRIFVEIGVRNNCTNWISATLKDKPHLAVPVDVKGVAADAAWLRAVAALFVHNVSLDFSALISDHQGNVAQSYAHLWEYA